MEQRIRLWGEQETVTRVNDFRGNDSSNWQSDLLTYQSVSFGEVYDGIDVILKAYGNNVEKLFLLQPGANPEAIRLRIRGGQNLTLTKNGELEVQDRTRGSNIYRPRSLPGNRGPAS